ncbi:MAG: hypothetical protein JJU45_06405 [Acidimicrobiia bacterium]|nr:hypothetical protein [Acidimicrobiia bacterium]
MPPPSDADADVATEPAPPATSEAPLRCGEALDLGGLWRVAPADDTLRRGYTDHHHDDEAWEDLTVPGHWSDLPSLSEHHGSVLHRRHFDWQAVEAEPPGTRVWLVFDGVFATSDVWLDGTYLGDTEGYFVPHSFEVTDLLATSADSVGHHLLALEAACPEVADPRTKQVLTGVYQHGPFPLGDRSPGGIWRPVRIERSGPVRIERLRALCTAADSSAATVSLRAILDVADRVVPPATVRLRTAIGDHVDDREIPVAAGENRIEWQVTVTDPRLWWPRALGEPILHPLEVTVHTPDGEVSDRRRRRMGMRSIRWHGGQVSVNGERLFVKGLETGPAASPPARATGDLLHRQVEAACDAGLDLVRVRGHVAAPAFYDAADAAGLLVWQDLPLHGGYARSIGPHARRAARELVDLLGHHPSIAVWCGHDEPVPTASAVGGTAGSPAAASTPPRLRQVVAAQLRPSWSTMMLGRSVARTLRRSDPSRPVVPASGVVPGTWAPAGATHLRFGNAEGTTVDLTALLRAWPRLARLVGWADVDDVTTLRRLKWRPCNGFVATQATDAAAVRSDATADQTPPETALRSACAPVVVTVDPLPSSVVAGEVVRLAVHVVNDLRSELTDADVELVAELAGHAVAHRRWRGSVPADDVAYVTTAELTVPDGEGPLVVTVRMSHPRAATHATTTARCTGARTTG